jgi:1-deoxy-D-xylulose-5-phosphate synthase
MLYTALKHPGPAAIRYPRGNGLGIPLDPNYESIPIGQVEILKEGEDLVIIALGSMVSPSMEAAALLEKEEFSVGVINCRFVKPLDKKLVDYARAAGKVLVVEENVRQGGLGGAILELFNDLDVHNVRIKRIGLPDKFIEHGSSSLLREKYGLDTSGILEEARNLCRQG